QDSAASVWKAEKVSSYHSAWPSYRAIPGPTLPRLAGIPGSDHVVRSVAGIDAGAVGATARDRDQRDRLAGEPCALSHQDRFVMPVEGRAVMPLDRADEDQGGRDRRPVSSHQIDLHLVGPGPVTPDDRGGGKLLVRQEAGERLADQRFDGAAPVGAPA